MTHPWRFTVFLALLLSPAAHGARIPLETHGARKSPPPAVPLVLPLKGTAAHCIKAAKNHTGGNLHAMCNEWEGAVGDLHTAVSLWKRIWGSDTISNTTVESTFGSKDALVSVVIDGISALRMNVTEWAAQMDSNRRNWVKNVNDALDTYANHQLLGNTATLLTLAIALVPCLNELSLAGGGFSDIISGFVAKKDMKGIEDTLDRGLDTVFLSEQGRHVKGMMDLLQITDFMENATDPAMGSVGRMVMHYVSSAAASNRTFTTAVVRSDLDRLGDVTPSDLEGYVNAVADATFDTSSVISSALSVATRTIVVGFISLGSSLGRFGVHAYQWRANERLIREIYEINLRGYEEAARPYTSRRSLEDVFTDGRKIHQVQSYLEVSNNIKKLRTLIGGVDGLRYNALPYINMIRHDKNLEVYFNFKIENGVPVACTLKDPGSQQHVIQELTRMVDDKKHNIINTIWKNANAEVEILLDELLPSIASYAEERKYIMDGQRAMEFMEPPVSHENIASLKKADIWIEKLNLNHRVFSRVERETDGRFIRVYTLSERDILVVRRELQWKMQVLQGKVINLAAETDRRIAALKEAIPRPEHNSRSFAERTAAARRMGIRLTVFMMLITEKNLVDLALTVINLQKTFTAIALNDAAIMNDVLKTVQAWREM